MVEQILAGVGLALLLVLVLCLSFGVVQKLVLEVYTWALRLSLLALLALAIYGWFRPEDLAEQVTDTLNNFPRLKPLLPDPQAQHFGMTAVALVVALLLPVLAVLDVCRKLAGRRLTRLHALTAAPAGAPADLLVPKRKPSSLRSVDRNAAADAMAKVSTRKPSPAADGPEQ
jgi:hypothetical protein